MSRLDQRDAALRRLPFRDLPPDHRVRIFGVDYAVLRLSEGGEFYVTRYGWSRLDHIVPEQWFAGQAFAKKGQKLPGSTAMVYRVPTSTSRGRRLDLVVKFSRFGQYVPLYVDTTFPDHVPPDVIASAHWNDPFEEVGMLMDLRRGRFGPGSLRILTKRPLGIYCPAPEYQDWQLGRDRSLFSSHNHMLEAEQREAGAPPVVHLHTRREYVMIYEWVKGHDAEWFWQNGDLVEGEVKQLTTRVVRELRSKGFRVLDNKPRHFILRKRRGAFMRRGGELVYALVDFELLQRTREYEDWLRARPKTTSSPAGRNPG